MARGAARTFLVHASLVRPLGEGGRCRLAADFAQLQAALSPLCSHLATDLGPEYAALTAARPLLFASPSDIAASPALGDPVISHPDCQDCWLCRSWGGLLAGHPPAHPVLGAGAEQSPRDRRLVHHPVSS